MSQSLFSVVDYPIMLSADEDSLLLGQLLPMQTCSVTSGTASLDLAMNAGDWVSAAITVANAIVGSCVRCGFNPALPPGLFVTPMVSSAGVVTVSIINLSGGSLSLSTICKASVDL